MIFKTRLAVLLISTTILLAQRCSSDAATTTTAAAADFSLNGSYMDTLATQQVVTNTTWVSKLPGLGSCTRAISTYDNTALTATYKEGSTVCFNANKFGKVYFTTDTAKVKWYCDFTTAKTTLAEVTSVTTKPTTTSPSTGGCGGTTTPWTKLATLGTDFALVGTFVDNFAGGHTYTNTSWADTFGCTKDIIFYDNTNGFFLYQEQAGGCFNPYKFGKVFWTADSSKKLYYCELLFGQNSYLATGNNTAKPTYTNPATSGCSGFSWSQLTRQ